MTEREVELFNDSLERCTANPAFLERFYEVFLGSSKEVADKFKKTDFKRQRRVLKSSLFLLLYAVEGKPEGLAHLDRMAEIHSKKGFDIRPELYDQWLKCLMQVVHEYDPYCTAETDQAWRHALQVGIDYIKSRYDAS